LESVLEEFKKHESQNESLLNDLGLQL
jgi:hypothetical protein